MTLFHHLRTNLKQYFINRWFIRKCSTNLPVVPPKTYYDIPTVVEVPAVPHIRECCKCLTKRSFDFKIPDQTAYLCSSDGCHLFIVGIELGNFYEDYLSLHQVITNTLPDIVALELNEVDLKLFDEGIPIMDKPLVYGDAGESIKTAFFLASDIPECKIYFIDQSVKNLCFEVKCETDLKELKSFYQQSQKSLNHHYSKDLARILLSRHHPIFYNHLYKYRELEMARSIFEIIFHPKDIFVSETYVKHELVIPPDEIVRGVPYPKLLHENLDEIVIVVVCGIGHMEGLIQQITRRQYFKVAKRESYRNVMWPNYLETPEQHMIPINID